MSEQLRGNLEMEKTREIKGIFIGRLGDLNLGNKNGIPSKYAEYDEATLTTIAEQNAHALIDPTDLSCSACIDGRSTLHNADGSIAETRLRRVGGSASNFGVALNAEASVTATLDPNASLSEQVQVIDDFMGERSAHEGGCGGANGEITDNDLIANDPAILDATRTLMSVPEVAEYFGFGYDDTLAARVRDNASWTAEFMRANGWDGQKYVDGVIKQNPNGVERLAVDTDDHEFHGHKEPTVTIVIGDKAMPLDHDGFVWNLKATKQAAQKLAGQRGDAGYQQAVIADIAKHMAVCKRLPSDKTPVMLVAA